MITQNKKYISWHSRMITWIGLFIFASPTFADSYNLMIGVRYTSIILQSVAIGLGVALMLGSLLKFKRYGESRTFMSQQSSIGRPVGMLISAVCLLCFPLVINTLRLSIFGDVSPLAYPAMSSPESNQMIKPVIALIRIVGIIGIMRGIILMSRAGGEQAQPGSIGKAMLHIIGGLMCVQILYVWNIMGFLFSFTIG